MSASGVKKSLVNALELGEHDDINRVQEYVGAHLGYLLGYMALASTTEDDSSAGTETLPTTTTDPLSAVILNGLRFLPSVGGTSATITGGALVMANPDGVPDADDSPVKTLWSGTISGLVLTSNSSGSTRIDVVEIQRAEAITQEPRLVLNPTSENFILTNVDKVGTATVTARIRTGTAGAGFPGTSSGWLPIAVCSVPTGTTTWDTVTVWDVRPLLSDFRPTAGRTRLLYGDLTITDPAYDGTHYYADGYALGQLGNWLCGGTFTNTVDLASSSYQEPSLTWATTDVWGLWLAMPFGLPRWVRYSTSGSRVPSGPRGLPILAKKLPTTEAGTPSSALTLPAGLGFGAPTTSNAMLVLTGSCNISPSTRPLPVVMANKWAESKERGSVNSGTITTVPNWTLTAGTHYAGTARRLRVRYSIALTAWNASGNAYLRFTVYDNNSGTKRMLTTIDREVYVTAGASTSFGELDIPLWSKSPVAAESIYIEVSTPATSPAVTNWGSAPSHSVQVIAEDFGG
jgi:hypothetical protein